MDAVGREVRHAARRLVRSPAFTLASVLTLALAVGASAAMFTVVYRVVVNPLPYPDSGRLIAHHRRTAHDRRRRDGRLIYISRRSHGCLDRRPVHESDGIQSVYVHGRRAVARWHDARERSRRDDPAHDGPFARVSQSSR